MVYTASELATLARAYCEPQGITLAALGETVFENHKFFKLLAAGKGAHSRQVEAASAWFEKHWPAEVPWPKSVSRPRAESEAA